MQVFRLELDLVGQPMHVPQRAFRRGIDGPHRQRGADAGLVIGPRQRLAINVFTPVAQLAQQVGAIFTGPSSTGRSISFRDTNRPPERFRGSQGRWLTASSPAAALGSVADLELAIAQARMLEPRQGGVSQRLAQQVMVETRQPLRLGDEVVQPRLPQEAHRHVFAAEFQFQVGAGVLLLVPILLEILQQEVAIADLAHLGREGKASAQFLAMLFQEPVAIVDVGFGQDLVRP